MFHVNPQDFFSAKIWLAAFTQAAWSSGAGWGMFHVYYVYAAKDEDIELNAFTVTFGDMVAAMLAGMVVLPAVFALSPDPEAVMKAGANGLTFVHLTNLFAHTSGGFVMAVLFFIALFSAELSSVIAMLETGTRNLIDMGFSRVKATMCVAIFFLFVGSFSALDNRVFENQDMVWGVGLLVVGLIYSLASLKYGVDKLWEEDIMPCSDIHVKVDVELHQVLPLRIRLRLGLVDVGSLDMVSGRVVQVLADHKVPVHPRLDGRRMGHYRAGLLTAEWGHFKALRPHEQDRLTARP